MKNKFRIQELFNPKRRSSKRVKRFSKEGYTIFVDGKPLPTGMKDLEEVPHIYLGGPDNQKPLWPTGTKIDGERKGRIKRY